MRTLAPVVILLLAPPAFAENEHLQKARQIVEELQYAEAAHALDAAWNSAGNDRETVLEILRLQAVVAATLGQPERARQLFRTLCYLAPDFVLSTADLGPKVTALFYEARGRILIDGALEFVAAVPRRN